MEKEIKFRAWDKKEKKWIDDTDIAINQRGLLFLRSEGQTDFHPISLTKSANYKIVCKQEDKAREETRKEIIREIGKYEKNAIKKGWNGRQIASEEIKEIIKNN